MKSWQGKTVLVVGAARQGLAASRYLAAHGTEVILTDSRPEKNFIEQIKQFEGLPVHFIFGSHPLSLLEEVDGICVSGGVPLDIPIILQARRNNIPLTNDTQLFLDIVKCKVIGITGSAGKTTTTTLIGSIAKESALPDQNVWVGGNIGNPLIDDVDKIKENDWVIMELSSFQLDLLETSPYLALVLNITPNHLDRHKTMRAYTHAKANILRYQKSSDRAVLNREDPGSFKLKQLIKSKFNTFGIEKPKKPLNGTYINNDSIHYFNGKGSFPVVSKESIHLIGKHNLMNALAACAAGITAGFETNAITKGISKINEIPHRLELVRELRGVHWYNDSIATAPERVIAAINAIPGSLVLLLGGQDKKLPWNDLAALLHERKPKVITFGEAGPMIKNALHKFEANNPKYPIVHAENLEDAFHKAEKIAEPGDVVLLSPGGTSYDAYTNFEERGEHFIQLVEAIK